MKIKCKHCQSPNDPLARFCGACGRKLLRTTRFIRSATGEISRVTAAEPAPADDSAPRCFRCDALIMGDLRFCTSCGARLQSETASNHEPRAGSSARGSTGFSAAPRGASPAPGTTTPVTLLPGGARTSPPLLWAYAAALSVLAVLAVLLLVFGVVEVRVPDGRDADDPRGRGATPRSTGNAENIAPLSDPERAAALEAVKRLRRFTTSMRSITGGEDPGVESRRLSSAARRLDSLDRRLESGSVDRAQLRDEIRGVRADLEFTSQALRSSGVLGKSTRDALDDLEKTLSGNRGKTE